MASGPTRAAPKLRVAAFLVRLYAPASWPSLPCGASGDAEGRTPAPRGTTERDLRSVGRGGVTSGTPHKASNCRSTAHRDGVSSLHALSECSRPPRGTSNAVPRSNIWKALSTRCHLDTHIEPASRPLRTTRRTQL